VQWLDVVRRLQRISQAGLTYCESPYDRERYDELLGIAAEITAASINDDVGGVEAILHAERGYATPKIDVRAVVPKDGTLLFVRESADGLWSLPGGWADIGSSPAEMAVREVSEETGYEVRAVKLLALLDKAKHEHPPELWYTYKAFMRCELLGGSPAPNHEVLEVAFFAEHELPDLSLPRNTERQVRRMFEHVKNPDLPTDFD
jgi:ADP-ribose pyrophosphatase YjhB (NUDIX family)